MLAKIYVLFLRKLEIQIPLDSSIDDFLATEIGLREIHSCSLNFL